MKNLISLFSKYKYFLIIGILIFVIVIIGQQILIEDETIEQSSTTAEVIKGSISSTISSSGTIETANYLAVTTSVNGIVKEVFVQEGDSVYKGQRIMEVILNSSGEESSTSAYASYLSAKTSLERAKSELLSKESALINATNSFEKEKIRNSYQTREERESYKIAENSYLVIKSDYDRQEDVIKQAEITLNKAWLSYQAQSPTIVAPTSGVIANILVVEGMDISNSLSERTSSTVASIRKEGTPIASLNITEIDINKVKVGQKVVIRLNSIANKQFLGKVVGIDKIGTVSSGISNYPVIVKFDEESDLVLPNMGVEAEIVIEERSEAIIVPTSAIENINKQKVIALIKESGVEQVIIETGISSDKYTEILSGLKEGDTVQIKSLPTEGFTTTTRRETERGIGIPGGGFMMR